jgi:hypothetical protein
MFKNYSIKIDVDNYESAISAFSMTPNSSISTWKGGTPADVFSDITSPTWVCDLTVAQDWVTPTSLALYLLNNTGKSVDVEFFPLGTGPSFTATLILASPVIGGAIDAWGESSVQCAVTGQPTFVPPVI